MNVCNSPQSYDGLLGDGQICAGLPQGGKDSCLGDSGGPLMTQQNGEYRQVGVVSFGRGCAEENFYGVYTRLEYYKEWISDMTGITNYEVPDETNAPGITDNNGPQSNDPNIITTSSSKPDSGGAGSLSAILPFLMLLLAAMVWRQGPKADVPEQQD